MAKYVKCIQGGLGVPLTAGNCYKVVSDDGYGYLIENDEGLFEWYSEIRFEEPYDLPEAITFSSQQEFEDAVMKVVLERLSVSNTTYKDYHGTTTEFTIEDKQ